MITSRISRSVRLSQSAIGTNSTSYPCSLAASAIVSGANDLQPGSRSWSTASAAAQLIDVTICALTSENTFVLLPSLDENFVQIEKGARNQIRSSLVGRAGGGLFPGHVSASSYSPRPHFHRGNRVGRSGAMPPVRPRFAGYSRDPPTGAGAESAKLPVAISAQHFPSASGTGCSSATVPPEPRGWPAVHSARHNGRRCRSARPAGRERT
ncbi:MAG: hypothetical protein JWP89_2365 [Schlesneria sp.]|nr:hypothetical protein [Schlesneria sp.]